MGKGMEVQPNQMPKDPGIPQEQFERLLDALFRQIEDDKMRELPQKTAQAIERRAFPPSLRRQVWLADPPPHKPPHLPTTNENDFLS
jgi:hypothetical protein